MADTAPEILDMLGLGTRKAPRLNPQMVRDAWRLLAGLEVLLALKFLRRYRFSGRMLGETLPEGLRLERKKPGSADDDAPR